MHDLKISVIIPTLNRKSDLEKTLISISRCNKKPYEIIIIDQSDNSETENLCNNLKDLNLKYFHFEVKSLTLARNYWIEKVNKDSNIIQFFDDDVLLEKNYFNELERFFINNKNAKWWVGNIDNISRKITISKRIWLFLLSWKWKQDRFFVTKWWFNAMPFNNPNYIANVQRTHWCGMFFRKSVFDEWFKFEEQFMKYSLMEDCFLSYWVQEKFPDSLFYVPEIKLIHCESPLSRIANKQRIYQNIIHRYYFIKKFNKSLLAYLWTMFIFSIFDLMQYRTIKIIKYYIQWLRYVIKNNYKIWNPNFDFNKFIFW